MNKHEKLNYLASKHYNTWMRTYKEVENNLSDQQGARCVCGQLATGLHERNCRRFRAKIQSETIKQLKHLLP